MKRSTANLVLAAALGLLISCNPLLVVPLPSGMADTPLVQHVPYTGSFTCTVDPGSTPRDVYFVFTNPSLSQNAAQLPGVSGVVSVDGFRLPAPASQPLPSCNSSPQSLIERIAEFNRNPSEYLPAAPIPGPSAGLVSGIPAQNDTPGVTTGTFSLDLSAATTVNATCQAVVGPLAFADGRTRTLSVWVDNSDWNVAGEVNAAMLGDIASRFLKGPTESISDIYHWDTSVVGEPWGPQPYSNLISWDPNNTVTILLTHLNSSYSGGVIVGYFWAKDNFTSASVPGSNQRIMFYIDSHLYASLTGAETGYSPTNYWPKIVFSTLAHEFQHMIQFYQKQVVRGAATGTDTWINEMCSMLMEDLVADDLGVEGPRGVSTGDAGSPGNTLGRIPYFNASSNSSLAVTGANFGLTDYALAYAFGAWLIRNYGGPSLVQRIVQCPQTDSTAVVNAAAAYSGRAESMERLLERWSASVLLSDSVNTPPGYRYNTGGWIGVAMGSQVFNLGSIDFFNYNPPLATYSNAATIPAPPYYSSNTYFLAAKGLRSPRAFSVTLPTGVDMSIVLK